MLWYALQRFSLTCIEHKYLEKGHTQNENDTMHSSIESASKKYPFTQQQLFVLLDTKNHTKSKHGFCRFFLL